jgi:DNA-binding NarL/FixJ family response regulator
MSKFRILIIEDEPIIAQNLAMYIESDDFEISAIAYDVQEALLELKSNTPDAVLLDIHLEHQNDGFIIANFINTQLQIPYLFITSYSDEATLAQAQLYFPYGFIVKPFNKSTIIASLKIALNNFHKQKFSIISNLSLEQINKKLVSKISEREFQILEKLINGYANNDIANQLFLSINTIKSHIKSIYLKLDVSNRYELIIRVKKYL